jgi:hypothetical protein
MRPFLGPLDPAALTYRWTHPDPRMDELHRTVSALVAEGATFQQVRARAAAAAGVPTRESGVRRPAPERPIPARLTEPWFC